MLGSGAAQASALRQSPVPICDDANERQPYTYFERQQGRRSGRLTGYSVELLRLILDKHGIAFRVDLLPWKRGLEAVARGQDHLMQLNATRNPAREQDFLFSLPTYSGRIDVLLVGDAVFQNLSSLGGYDFAGDAELGRAALPVREPNRFHMLFTRKDPRGTELQALENRKFEALQRSGELRALLAKFVGSGAAPP